MKLKRLLFLKYCSWPSILIVSVLVVNGIFLSVEAFNLHPPSFLAWITAVGNLLNAAAIIAVERLFFFVDATNRRTEHLLKVINSFRNLEPVDKTTREN